MEPGTKASFIAIARVVRTRGNRGEVLAELHTDSPARFQQLDVVWLEFPDGRMERIALEETWEHKGRQVLKLQGFDSITEAETLRGAWVMVESREAVELPEGTYFDHDLVGCALMNAQGEDLGRVREILRIPGNTQLVVEGPRGEYMIPAASGFCREVSIERRRILVDLPEGLMDLNE